MRWNGNSTARSNVFYLDGFCLLVHKLMLLISTFIASLSQRQRKKSSFDTAMSTSSYLHCIGKECCICFPNSGGYTYLLPDIARSRWICMYLSCLSVKWLCLHLPAFVHQSNVPIKFHPCERSIFKLPWHVLQAILQFTNNAYNSFCHRRPPPFHDKLL